MGPPLCHSLGTPLTRVTQGPKSKWKFCCGMASSKLLCLLSLIALKRNCGESLPGPGFHSQTTPKIILESQLGNGVIAQWEASWVQFPVGMRCAWGS